MNSLRQVELDEGVAVGHGSFAEPVVSVSLGGRYELGRLLRSGPDGVTYLAADHVGGRDVEITVLDPQSADDRAAIRRAEATVWVAERLIHPNVRRTLDWGTDEHRFYLVRESVQGQTLDELLAVEGELPATRAARIGADVAAALAAAHGAGVHHGRLDAGAIVVTTAGLVKVDGFGSTPAVGPTGPGDDLRQLGAVLRAMIADEDLVEVEEPEVLDALYVDDAPAGGRVASLGDIVDRLTNDDRGLGYRSAEAAEADLRGYRETPPVPASTPLAPPPLAPPPLGASAAVEPSPPPVGPALVEPSRPHGTVDVEPSPALVGSALPAPQPVGAPAAADPPPPLVDQIRPLLDGTGSATPSARTSSGGPPIEQPDSLTNSPLFLVGLAGALIVMISLAIYVANAVSGSASEPPDAVAVPTVIGDPSDVAIERLVAAGFVVEEVLVETDEHEAGTVFAQDPPPRSGLVPGQTITVSIARALAVVVVPDVVDEPRTEAIDVLTALGLDVDLRREPSDVIEFDRVISQSLRPGDEVGEGVEITVVVSTGPERLPVPDLAGLPVAEATAVLEEQNLDNVRWEYEPSDEVPEDTIVRTEPAAGTQIELTAPITVFVSTGNNNFVPGVVGLDRDQAERLLRDSGFKPQVESVTVDGDSGLVGYVVAQGPDTGTLQPIGSNVWIQVGKEDKSLIDRLLGGDGGDDDNRRGNRRRGRGDRDDD